MEHSTENTTTDKSKVQLKDILYVFAVLLILVSCFDLLGTIFALGITFGSFNALIPPIGENETIYNLFLNFGAQAGAIMGFLILYKLRKIEPEEKKNPKGPFIQITYVLHALDLIFILTVVLAVTYILEEILDVSTTAPTSIEPTLASLGDPLFFILFFGVLAVGAPIWEELVFRRTLIPMFERRGFGQAWALLFTSLMFSLRHTPTDLFEGSLGFAISHFFSTLIGGLMLGFLYLRTRNIFWPILLHSITNSVSGLAQIANTELEAGLDISMAMIASSYWLLIAIGVGAVATLYFGVQLAFRGRRQFKPIWLQIITETKNRTSSILTFTLLVICFILFSGAVPIFFDYVADLMNPTSEAGLYLVYTFQIFFFAIIVGILGLFIFRKAQPFTKPIFVSTKVVDPTAQTFIRKPDFIPTVIPADIARCVSCGNTILPNAKFCAFCGSVLSIESDDPDKWEKI
ncbi:MAG: CPBP family glutamic-type intramembrane protease [Candidatus Hodarchaeales archaeon]|jgi:membrane protease YdiL (CAAX protease family)